MDGWSGGMCMKSMASYLVSALLLIWLCLHAHVHGRELQGLKRESQHSLHNDSHVTSMQKEVASPKKNFVEKDAQSNLLSESGGYSRGQSLIEQYPLNYRPHDASSQFINHWAGYQSLEGKKYGTKATINVWSLQGLNLFDSSAAVIWVENKGNDSLESRNVIQAGWHADGYQKTGCYNFDCPGFVHTNHSLLVPGYRLEPTSNFDGAQYYITLKIYKDPQTGDWLLFEGSGDAKNFIGYWPKTLFTSLAESASVISWGGVVTFRKDHTSPPMGSGHFPREGEGKAASFKHLQYVDHKGDLYDPIPGAEIHFTDKEECYTVDVLDDSNDHGGFDGWMFHFGGPGNCNNLEI